MYHPQVNFPLDCPSGKIPYPGPRWANRAAQENNQQNRLRQYVYPCRECGYFHTSKKKGIHNERPSS